MKVNIDHLMSEICTPDYPVEVLDSRRQERILNMTKKKIKAQRGKNGRHPLRLAAIMGAAVLLLCGTAFAAYELFGFTDIFGQEAAILDQAAVTFQPDTTPIPAQTGINATNFSSVEDYNFLLRGDVTVSDDLVMADFQVSKANPEAPDFSDSGLSIEIMDLDSQSFHLWLGDVERVSVYAQLEEPLAQDTLLTFLVTDGNREQVILADTAPHWVDASTVLFADHDPDLDYVVDSLSMTTSTITLEGHFQQEFDDFDAALDASGSFRLGNIPWPLYDIALEDYDPEEAQEDLEGYLTRREVTEEGDFLIQWTMTKHFPGYGTLVFGGAEYEISEPEQQEVVSDYSPVYASTAQTQDYQFTLESVAATNNTLCAIVRMEPLTDYGRAHMNLGRDELCIVVSNMTHGAGGTLGCELVESGEDTSRYLVYSLSEGEAVYQKDDTLHFEILAILEDGDNAEHSYSLFDAVLTDVVTDSAEAVLLSEGEAGLVTYDSITLTPMSLYMTGQVDLNGKMDGRDPMDAAMETPEITFTFRDGTSTLMTDADWHMDDTSGTYGVAAIHTSGANGGTISHSFLFSKTIDLENLDTITIGDTVYQVQ